MAIDPKELRVNYKDLLSVPIRDRVQMAQSSSTAAMIEALTPSQRAALFPRYYEEQLPDVSGFYKAMSGGLEAFKSRAGGTNQATGETGTYGPGPGRGKSGWRNDSSTRRTDERYIPVWEQRLRKEQPEMFAQGSVITADIPTAGKAFLDTLTGPGLEGTGENYNIIVGGNTFDDYADHPGIVGVRTAQGPSTAAGRYQITGTTWRDLQKRYPDQLPDFSPASQDKAAWLLAQERYRQNTGRDLTKDLESNDPQLISQVERNLSGTWSSLSGGVHEGTGAGGFVDKFMMRNEELNTAVAAIPDEPLNPEINDQQFIGWLNKQTPQLKKQIIAATNADIKKNGLDPIKKDIASYKATLENKFSVLRGKINGVDERLVDVIKAASKDLPEGYTVKMISGNDARDSGTQNHPTGLAMDVEIYDDKGRLLDNRNYSPDWKVYEQMARSMKIRGEEMYPDTDFMWGGAWNVSSNTPADAMHYQVKDPTVRGSSQSMGAYSWEGGLDKPFASEVSMSPEERAIYDEKIKKKIEEEKNPTTTTVEAPRPEPVMVQADATNMPADRPFSLAPGSKIDTMKKNLVESTPKPMPEQKLEIPRDDRAPVETSAPAPQESAPGKTDAPAPQNQASVKQSAAPTPPPVEMYSGTQMGAISPSQARAYNRVGENLHRDGTSFV